MSILKIARMGHPVLRTRARRVELSDIKSPAFQKLIDDMIETMEEYHGIGLAAPQVHESVRLVLVGIEEGRDGEASTLRVVPVVNPEVAPVGSEVAEDWEGCLSVPDLRGRVPRAVNIRLRGLDRKGGRLDLELHDFPARVAQHEVDHLDGVLFVHRMKSLDTLSFLEEFGRYWQRD
jgi:peptide deformylase